MDYFASPKTQKNDDLEVTGISRSGRVRKKSSKLVDFESPDDVTEHKLKKQKAQQQAQVLQAQQRLEKYEQQWQQQKFQNFNAVQQITHVQQRNSTNHTNVFQQKKNFEQPVMQFKQTFNQQTKQEFSSEDEEETSEESESESANGLENDDSSESMSDEEVDPLLLDDMEEDQETEVEPTGFTKLEPPEQVDIPNQAKSSLYMLEKYKKKLIIKDGKVINNKPIKSQIQRKDKGKTRYTAYMLWSKEVRQQLVESHPDLDFAAISKKLGELWATVPHLEKYNWRKRAKRCAINPSLAEKYNKTPTTPPRQFINKMGNRDNLKFLSPPRKVIQLENSVIGTKVPVSPSSHKTGKDSFDFKLKSYPCLGTGMYKVTGTQPIDIAAHLTLLGESLTIVGKKIKEHEGQITVSGSLSLLLDSLLCALGPLLCLTQQIPEMNGADPECLSSVLENVAYIMPGM